MNHTYFAVFGSPVLHSKSPQLFGPLLEAKSNNFYTRIRPQSAKDLVHIVRLLDIRGGSITAPFKETVLPLIDKVHPAALKIGAVNCIRQQNGYIEGDNTDHLGVTGALLEAGVSLKGAEAMVLGAGGAAKAAVYGLANAGARVAIANRTFSKARKLADEYGCDAVPWETTKTPRRVDVVVSALLPEVIPPFMDSLNFDILLDAIYKPSAPTEFARGKGIPVIGGEKWLIHQGVEAAAFYIGERPEPSTLAQELHKSPDPGVLKVFVLTNTNIQSFPHQHHDLVISGFGMNETTINHLIDEEKELAFGG